MLCLILLIVTIDDKMVLNVFIALRMLFRFALARRLMSMSAHGYLLLLHSEEFILGETLNSQVLQHRLVLVHQT